MYVCKYVYKYVCMYPSPPPTFFCFLAISRLDSMERLSSNMAVYTGYLLQNPSTQYRFKVCKDLRVLMEEKISMDKFKVKNTGANLVDFEAFIQVGREVGMDGCYRMFLCVALCTFECVYVPYVRMVWHGIYVCIVHVPMYMHAYVYTYLPA